MKFKINDRTWKIKELTQEEIKQHMKDYKFDGEPEEEGRYYGQTYFDEQTIYIDKDLNEEQKLFTLMHELGHCYIGVFITHQDKQYNEEEVVNIVSNSHFIIHDIITKFYQERGGKENATNKD